MRSLYWFRNDVRASDNLALTEAVNSSDELVAVFILTPATWRAHDAAPCKIRFILENLRELSKKLWGHGIPLLIRKEPSFADCPKLLKAICKQHKIDAIYFNHEYPLDERERDKVVIETLK